MWSRAIAVVWLMGCGSSSASQAPVWVGLDSRPLAVGSQIPVDIDLSTDGGPLDSTVSSSDPSVVQPISDGGLQLSLNVVGAGSATLSFESNFGSTSYPVTAADPASVTFAIASRLVAGIDTALPPAPTGFALIYGGTEVVQALVYDTATPPNELNSWGLVNSAQGTGSLRVNKIEPERFMLTALGVGTGNTFVAGLPEQLAQSFPVQFVTAATASLVYSNGFVLAEAVNDEMAEVLEVLGLGDWVFACQPSASCTVDQLSLSVVQLSIPSGSSPGSFTVTASASPEVGETFPATTTLP
jgi:hypothetical protein